MFGEGTLVAGPGAGTGTVLIPPPPGVEPPEQLIKEIEDAIRLRIEVARMVLTIDSEEETEQEDEQKPEEGQVQGTGGDNQDPDKDPDDDNKKPPNPPRDWDYGEHKSRKKWENQMQDREWTEDQITDTINNGEKHEAPNRVRQNDPDATATRYEKDGRFVVVDDQTKELLQISGPGDFKPIPLP